MEEIKTKMAKRLTNEEVIARAKSIHGDRYNYDKVDYQRATEKIIITCKKHGDFLQLPHSHFAGHNCPKCEGRDSHSKETFIKKARNEHGDRYDYSKVKYEKTSIKVIIGCKKHGEFLQTPHSHLKGMGCPKCGYESISRKNKNESKCSETLTDEFIGKANVVHGDKYRYDKVVYQSAIKKVKITCPKHGDFMQRPQNHLAGYGCYHCGIETIVDDRRTTAEEFIKRAKEVHGDRFVYDLTNYKNLGTKIPMTCTECGTTFKQSGSSHVTGVGCIVCFRKGQRFTPEQFAERAKEVHGDLYLYDRTGFTRTRDKVLIGCKKHGYYEQVAINHLQGSGCLKCNKSDSVQEKELAKFLKQFTKVKRNDRKILGGKELDIVLPEYKIAIEYNGLYWHSTKFLSPNYDK